MILRIIVLEEHFTQFTSSGKIYFVVKHSNGFRILLFFTPFWSIWLDNRDDSLLKTHFTRTVIMHFMTGSDLRGGCVRIHGYKNQGIETIPKWPTKNFISSAHLEICSVSVRRIVVLVILEFTVSSSVEPFNVHLSVTTTKPRDTHF